MGDTRSLRNARSEFRQIAFQFQFLQATHEIMEKKEGSPVKKVFHFDAPREKYLCDAAVIWCFDNRFELGFRKFLKRRGVSNTDPVKIAGGAKWLATPELEAEREFVLEQIRKSIHLHGTRRVILMLHSDCGAYGGLEQFGGDTGVERI